MLEPKISNLSHIGQLINKGQLDEAFQLVGSFETKKDLSVDEHLKCLLLKSKLMNKWGRYEEGLHLAKQILKETYKSGMYFQEIDAIIIMAEALWRLGKLNKGLKKIEEGEKALKRLTQRHSTNLAQRKVNLLNLKGTIYRLKGELDQALTFFQQSLALSKEFGNKRGIAESLHNIGNIYYLKGRLNPGLDYYQQALVLCEQINDKQAMADSLANIGLIYLEKEDFSQALNYYMKALTLREQIGNKQDIAKSLDNIATLYFCKGEFDQALSIFQQSFALRKEIRNKYHIAVSLSSIGTIYHHKGELNQALTYYQQGLKLYRQINHKRGLAFALGNIGEIYNLKGALNQALECFRDSLAYFNELGNKRDNALTLINIGKIYRQKGDLDIALDYYQRSLGVFRKLASKSDSAASLHSIGSIYWQKGEWKRALEYLHQSLGLREEIGNNLYTAEVLYSLINVSINKNSLQKAQYYLQCLQEINTQEENKFISQQCRIGEALLLKTSTRLRDWGRAEELFEKIIEEEIIDHELTVLAMLNLCDLLLLKLRTSNDHKILEEVQTIVVKLLNIAKEQHSHSLLVETYILRAKLALLNLNLQSARRLFTQAQLTAEEKDLHRLAIKVSHEHDFLLNKLTQWQTLTSRQVSMSERLELSQLKKTLICMERKEVLTLPELVEEEPVLLSIFNGSESIVFSKRFNVDQNINARLIGHFLSSMNTFSTEIFAHPIERVKINEYTMLIHTDPPLLWCYVFKGQSYLAQQKFTKFIKEVSNITPLWQKLSQLTQLGHFLSEWDKTVLEDLIKKSFKERASDKSNLNLQWMKHTAKRNISNYWCWNQECQDYYKKAKGNIAVKERKGKERRALLMCKTCGQTFSETRGTIFFGLHTPQEEILRVLALLSKKGSIRAVARETGHDRKTISYWLKRASAHANEVTNYFLNDLKLTQNQVDKIWTFLKNKKKKKASIIR
ncbi:MAG: tetratricopeptide repeat protein [Candidatus Hermodarchaeota archaeon]